MFKVSVSLKSHKASEKNGTLHIDGTKKKPLNFALV